jgi:hypothetical protein
MTDIETVIRSELDRRYPRRAPESDWDDVLARADTIERTTSLAPMRRRRRPLILAFATAVLAAAAVSLVLVSPWSGGPGLMQQALAALGSGRYLHLVLESPTSSVSWIDLASGKRHPVLTRVEWVYDTKTGAYDSRGLSGGFVMEGATMPDPVVSRFATGYRTALANGEARVVGDAIVGDVKATIIRFAIRLGTDRPVGYEDIAVSVTTRKPLQVAWRSLDARGKSVGRRDVQRVVSIGTTDARPRLPKASPSPSVVSFVTDVRPVTIGTAKAAFGHTSVWPGSTVAGATLSSIRLQRVTTSIALPSSISRTLVLRLDYRAAQGALVVEEAPNAKRSYGSWPATLGTRGPLSAAGRAVLWCDWCGAPSGSPRVTWHAQLRTSGLYVDIRSTNRSLVIAAARALVPLR